MKKIIPTLTDDTESVQRLICNDCGAPVLSDKHRALKKIRVSVRLFVDKFICLLRFKEGLSLRSISRIVGFVFGINASLGYLSKFTNAIGQKAVKKLPRLSTCKASRKAVVAIIDETFPRIFHRSVSLGLVICEYGLIRAVRCVKRSSSSLKGLLFPFRQGTFFHPIFLLGDFNPSYAKTARQLGLVRLTDFVHAVRHIYWLVRSHLGSIRLKTGQGCSRKKKKQMLKLKKRLLRKTIMPIIRTLFKGFNDRYRAVGHFYILGSLAELQRQTERFPSLLPLYKAINKFVTKYIDTWRYQMLIGDRVPITSNSVESKNSIFRIFSRRIKAFCSKESMVLFFSAVALWENFDVKKRGPYRGTSAIERAGIDLDDFGASNFFEAVGLQNVSRQNPGKVISNKIIFHLFKQILDQAA